MAQNSSCMTSSKYLSANTNKIASNSLPFKELVITKCLLIYLLHQTGAFNFGRMRVKNSRRVQKNINCFLNSIMLNFELTTI